LVPGGFACFVDPVVDLAFTDLGGAGLPPMLVLHGMLGSSRNWQTVGRDLATRHHVLALDARNHGRSPHDPEMTYEAMVGDLLAWMDGHNLPRVTLVGHSMGGKTAMLLACRHAARVERLVVVDIAPKDYHWAAHRAEFAAMNELDLGSLQSRGEAEMRFEARVASLGMRKFLATNLERTDAGQWRWLIDLPALTAALPRLEKNCLAADDRFAGPARFIAGGLSQYVQPADHEVIRRHFPAARIDVIADAGHNPHMDRREAFVRLVGG
jgi:pimeloyl-ACP methyl ester carboxylesterase